MSNILKEILVNGNDQKSVHELDNIVNHCPHYNTKSSSNMCQYRCTCSTIVTSVLCSKMCWQVSILSQFSSKSSLNSLFDVPSSGLRLLSAMPLVIVSVMAIVVSQITTVNSVLIDQHHSFRPNVTDLVVGVGEDVLLECPSPTELNLGGNSWTYRWCRYDSNRFHNRLNKSAEIMIDDTSTLVRSCFNGSRHFIANENHISTIVYRCSIHLNHRGNLKLGNRPARSKPIAIQSYKLYVDQFSRVQHKRDITSSLLALSPQPSLSPLHQLPIHPQSQHSLRPVNCKPPRCKPYAVAIRAHCSSIELSIRYPSSQYGYNHSTDHWGTILCNDQIGGYQIWLIGYGIVKKFLPNDRIILDQLIPGKRYCFNGWAYNACGSGPVFTLEGICAKNDHECHSSSDEHCELDLDYSY